ncbi:MAG: class I SAM-dependent methyltransferase [Woeseia sp.]
MCAPDDAQWEWSAFWRSDQPRSCRSEAGDDAANALDGRWRRFLRKLDDGARLLDLATGNGILAHLAATESGLRDTGFDVVAVDAANIDPANFVTSAATLLRKVRFHAETRLEELPFADSEFDAVVSQYGIEYSDTSRSVGEAIRVLRPGGSLCFLVHASDGELAERCSLQLRQAQSLLDSGLFEAFNDMLREIVAAESGSSSSDFAAAQSSIQGVGSLVAKLEAGFASDSNQSLTDRVLAAVRELPALRKTSDPDALYAMLANIQFLLKAQARRLSAMQNAALSEQQAARLCGELQSLTGADVQLERAMNGEAGQCVGFWIDGSKPV